MAGGLVHAQYQPGYSDVTRQANDQKVVSTLRSHRLRYHPDKMAGGLVHAQYQPGHSDVTRQANDTHKDAAVSRIHPALQPDKMAGGLVHAQYQPGYSDVTRQANDGNLKGDVNGGNLISKVEIGETIIEYMPRHYLRIITTANMASLELGMFYAFRRAPAAAAAASAPPGIDCDGLGVIRGRRDPA
ncbi:unnamed protein product [Plutella xylostella]|uniref:(diamondback moth) hypothetical protein n=1 Tax=Plutella xylostella TaxID=51655 RepID=A0A8S4EPF3_PLUXY|nr:unnamed protein product [Plutella xylostella]